MHVSKGTPVQNLLYIKVRMNISIAVVSDVAEETENLLKQQDDQRYLAIEKAAKQGTFGSFGIVLCVCLAAKYGILH
ncbi:unnamed protein product [Oikopleura dioica]|uniref:Uncharacterized protein n=1 Tax=Oikopleura dioica TaxID=34765 RepID=E4XA53_OIKDI|nr:unnamed protein product [Oikopleura dioica]